MFCKWNKSFYILFLPGGPDLMAAMQSIFTFDSQVFKECFDLFSALKIK